MGAAVAGLCNIKPLSLPLIGSFDKRAFWPRSVGELANYSTAALNLFSVDYLWFHTKGLDP